MTKTSSRKRSPSYATGYATGGAMRLDRPDPAMLALRYPFDLDLVTTDQGAATLMVNIRGNPFPLPDNIMADPARTHIWQWWKDAVEIPAGQGMLLPATGPAVGEGEYDIALIRLPRQREEGRHVIARAWAGLKAGGLLVVAATNDGGGTRLEKDLSWARSDLAGSDLAGDSSGTDSGIQSLSKYKSRVVWLRKDVASPCPVEWLDQGAPQKNAQTGLWTQAGLFSWNRIDKATALLGEYLPRDFSGVAVDAGCGYGALSLALLSHSPEIKKLHALDADARALGVFQQNIAEHYPDVDVECHWADFASAAPLSLAPVDLVVMNPPFHTEKSLSIDTGRAFIANAAALLKKQGCLIMVANAHLPYETLLAQCFGRVEKNFEGQGFKIFTARL